MLLGVSKVRNVSCWRLATSIARQLRRGDPMRRNAPAQVTGSFVDVSGGTTVRTCQSGTPVRITGEVPGAAKKNLPARQQASVVLLRWQGTVQPVDRLLCYACHAAAGLELPATAAELNT